MQFGPLIKFYRSEKGLTQKQLAKGICSISHLSKIENNSKEANDQTVSLLLERLHINIEEVAEQEVIIAQLLKQLHEKIYYYQKAEVECIIAKLANYEHLVPFTPHLFTYQLYMMRYYLFTGNCKEAKKQKDLLAKQKKLFSQHESYLFSYYHALLYMLRGQFQKAELELDRIATEYQIDSASGEFMYFRSMVKSALEQPGYAIHFAKNALQSYTNEHNFVRILHCLLLLGINYTSSGIYEEAMSCFRHAERNATLLQESSLLSQVYHNLGLLYKKLNDYPNALTYLGKSTTLHLVDSEHSLVTRYVMAQILFDTSPIEAKHAFTQTLDLAEKLEHKKYILLSKYYLLALEDVEEAIVFVTQSVLPYLESTKDNYQDLIMFYRLLAKHYQSKGLHENAIHYLNKTL